MLTLHKCARLCLLLILALAQAVPGFAQTSENRKSQRVLIEAPGSYDRIAAAVRNAGGRVLGEFKSIQALSVEIPEDAVDNVLAQAAGAVTKDIDVPRPRASGSGRSRVVHGLQLGPVVMAGGVPARVSSSVAANAGAHPQAYALNFAGMRIDELHAKGYSGQGTTVAVIDSGVRPGFPILDGAIAGGIDFVDDGPAGPAGDSPSDWSKSTNDGHGSFAAGLIAGKGSFTPSTALRNAIDRYAPGTLDSGNLSLNGAAPDSKIYVVRVFGNDASKGAPLSVILSAIQHVIDLKNEYLATNGRRGLRIDVCNLSLGISTLAAGRGLLERSVDALLEAGIVPVISAGNTGPSPMTISNPGSAMSAVTVGAVAHAANERILFDLIGAPDFEFPPMAGLGALMRPFSGTPVAWFSSRGPNADGRMDPDVVANGVANFGQGYCPEAGSTACDGTISIASGTSFSAPIVAGLAAALRSAFPSASANAIRNVIVDTATAAELPAGATVIDRGRGLPNAMAAFHRLRMGRVSNLLPRVSRPSVEVRRNVEDNTNLFVFGGSTERRLTGIGPGDHGEILYRVPKGTERVVVQVRNIVFSQVQNPVIGDAMFLDVHSAKTSSIGTFGDYLVAGFAMFAGEVQEFTFEDPDNGILRITLSGDTLNAGQVSATVSITTIREALPRVSREGMIRDKERKEFRIQVPAGAKNLSLFLNWDNDWARYPTSDLDLLLYAPGATTAIRSGATMAGPERVSIPNPAPGEWRVQVDGFDVPDGFDRYQLRMTLDGSLLKP